MISPDQDDAVLAEPLAGVRQHLKDIPSLYRVLGNSPEMLKAWVDFAWPLRLKASTPRPLREILILRGAQISKTAYEWAHHVPMALSAGVPQQKIEALADWQNSPLFDQKEKAALRLVEEVTRGPGASAEAMTELQRHFTDAEVVELVLTASFYVCVGRILESFAIELEPDYAHLRPEGW